MIRKAVVSDVEKVHKIINYFASKDLMLPRSLREIYENIRDYFVYIDGGEIIGCAALHVFWKDLSELKSLAVQEAHQKKGVGGELVRECIQEAKSLGVERLFVLTYQPEFFQHRSFRLVEKESLPHKIWTECIRCPKFPDCKEVPLILDIPTASAFQE